MLETTIVPNDTTAKNVVSILNAIGIPVKSAQSGIDVGIETSAGRRRTSGHMSSRIKAASRRSARASVIARINRKAKRVAVTGVAPVQDYGRTVQGLTGAQVRKQRTNMAKATGKSTGGACVTTLLRVTSHESWCCTSYMQLHTSQFLM